MTLNGQWIARYTGSNVGTLVADVEDFGDHYRGVACAWDENQQNPNTVARFRTFSKADAHQLPGVPLEPIDRNCNSFSQEALAQLHATGFARTLDLELMLRGQKLQITWKADNGGQGTAEASETQAGVPSELKSSKINTWESFKRYVTAIERKRFVFRGHEDNTWRLRTSFHRTGRSNLERYLVEDIANLHKALSPMTKHPFDLKDPLHNAAFINLLQHHGYPTPLLDWTWSPYVAAFFAFRKIRPNISANARGKIRIYKFDIREWNLLPRADRVFPVYPNISAVDALAYDNLRVVSQQAVSTVTNLDDMESYIRFVEQRSDKTFLEVIDLPAKHRQPIMHELAMMGITAGTLFPGIDGACESLKERNFY
jgi:hypothetical protein